MRKFTKTIFGVIVIVICLSTNSCENDIAREITLFSENSKVQLAPGIRQLIETEEPLPYDELQISIIAYEYYDLLPIEADHREHGGKTRANLENQRNRELWDSEKENLSEEELEVKKATIEAKFNSELAIWRSYRAKENLDLLANWFSKKGMTASLEDWSENSYENAHLTLTLPVEELLNLLLILQKDGPHICYHIDFANELDRPLSDNIAYFGYHFVSYINI